MKTCPTCNGSREVENHYVKNGQIVTKKETCPHCGGRGTVKDD